MRATKNQKGFTITELLIVVAITGTLFVITATLIKGQINRYSYQEGMRQLQQIVQQQIKDTENGYFPGATGQSTTGVYAGKRIVFCVDNPAPTDTDASMRQDCTEGSDKIRVENIYINPNDPTDTFKFNNAQYFSIPNGITYSKHLSFQAPAPQVKLDSTGFSIMFKNFSPADYGGQSIGLYEAYIDNNTIATRVEDDWTNASLTYYWDNGKRICFNGYKRGSLVIGRYGSQNVEVNLDDAQCY